MIFIQHTRLSCSGKPKEANEIKKYFAALNQEIEILDGNELHKYISNNLGFSRADRPVK